jgi:large subunit ribosomal protein L4
MADSTIDSTTTRLPLFSASQQASGEIELSAAVFSNQGDPALLHEAVRMQMANRRAGTAATKTRGLISGGGIKPWKQKHTGRARAGSTRSPLWRHGGTTFGPQPRDYSYRINKKSWLKALCLALSDRAQQGRVVVVEEFALPELKSKLAAAALKRLGLESALILLAEGEEQVALALRNLAAFKVLPVSAVNVYDLLRYPALLLTTRAARALEGRLGGGQ